MSFYNNREYKTRYDDSNYVCEACNCNGKSSICKYDRSISWVYNTLIGSILLTILFLEKGICQNCVNNTEGNNCESCKLNYFYDPFQRTCQKCFCNQYGILSTKPDDLICDVR